MMILVSEHISCRDPNLEFQVILTMVDVLRRCRLLLDHLQTRR